MKKKVKTLIALLLVTTVISCSFIYGDENIGEIDEAPADPIPPVTEPETPVVPAPPVTEPETPAEPAPPVEEPETPAPPSQPEQPSQPEPPVTYPEEIEPEIDDAFDDNSDEESSDKEDLLLESINIDVGKLKPEFSPETLDYIVYVEDEDAYCNIEAVSKNPDREIIYRGEYEFTEKTLERQIDVIGDNDDYLRYTIKFVKVEPSDFFRKSDQTLYSLGLNKKLVNKSETLSKEPLKYKGKVIDVLKSEEKGYSITMGTDYENKKSITWFVYDEDKSSFLPADVKTKGKKMSFKVNDSEITVKSKDGKWILEEKAKSQSKGMAGNLILFGAGAFALALIALGVVTYTKKRELKKAKNRIRPYLSLDDESDRNKDK